LSSALQRLWWSEGTRLPNDDVRAAALFQVDRYHRAAVSELRDRREYAVGHEGRNRNHVRRDAAVGLAQTALHIDRLRFVFSSLNASLLPAAWFVR
jgi:hypothetical protein